MAKSREEEAENWAVKVPKVAWAIGEATIETADTTRGMSRLAMTSTGYSRTKGSIFLVMGI
jgi:hypothetical protein